MRLVLPLLLVLLCQLPALAQGPPEYRAMRGFEPEAINTNAYGYYPWAKEALKIGDSLPPELFTKTQNKSDTLLVFYRGYW